MASCATPIYLKTASGEAVGVYSSGRNPSFTHSTVFVLSPNANMATCEHVFISAADYDQLRSAQSSSGGEVNVTADIFIGCLLVLCLIGGWIAGAQR